MKILNKHKHDIPKEGIYIGRGSIYGNPYVIGKHGTRDEVISNYEVYARNRIFNNDKEFIDAFKLLNNNSILVCFCTPDNDCHGRIIEKLWNEYFKLDTSIINPKLDGVTHINIYSKAKTELGRLLTNFSDIPINHKEYGYFKTLESFWQWLKTGKKHDIFRNLSAHQAKATSKDFPVEILGNFKQEIKKAVLLKIEGNSYLKELLKNSTLPFTHYYYYGDVDNCKVINVDNSEWLLDYISLVREYLNGKAHKLIIAGSRSITNFDVIKEVFDSNFSNNVIEIVSGGAKGVDKLGEQLADGLQIPKEIFLADWDNLGKSAGFVRNKQMGNYASSLLAVWDGKSPGTESMIEIMRTLDKPSLVVKVK